MASIRLAVLGAALCLTACGGDDDSTPNPFLGTFEVTSHTLSEMGCDMPNPLVEESSCFGCVVESPFFKIKRQTFFGESFLSVVECESATVCADDGDDEDTIDLGGAILDQKDGDDWVGHAYAASFGGASCSYTETEWRLTETEAGIELVRTVLRNTPESPSGMLTGDACLDQVDTPPARDELNCDSREIVSGAVPSE